MSKHSKKIKNLNKIVAIILIVIVASIILAISTEITSKETISQNIQNVTSIIKNGANSIMGNKSFDSKEVVQPNQSVKRN